MASERRGENTWRGEVLGILHVWGLIKNVQVQGAQKTEPRGVYGNTLSGVVCSATQQMSVFQQPHFIKTLGGQT
jgi:hypothetical protein